MCYCLFFTSACRCRWRWCRSSTITLLHTFSLVCLFGVHQSTPFRPEQGKKIFRSKIIGRIFRYRKHRYQYLSLYRACLRGSYLSLPNNFLFVSTNTTMSRPTHTHTYALRTATGLWLKKGRNISEGQAMPVRVRVVAMLGTLDIFILAC